MSKCASSTCSNEGWAAELVAGVKLCYKHWGDALSAIAKEKTNLRETTNLYLPLQHRDEKVYFLRGSGHIKIGHSKDPVTRLRAIRSGRDESCIPDAVDRSNLDCIGFIAGGSQTEAELHHKFDRYRVKGEWFIAAPELLDYVYQRVGGVTA